MDLTRSVFDLGPPLAEFPHHDTIWAAESEEVADFSSHPPNVPECNHFSYVSKLGSSVLENPSSIPPSRVTWRGRLQGMR